MLQVTSSRAHQRKQRTGVQTSCFRCLVSAGSKPEAPLLASRLSVNGPHSSASNSSAQLCHTDRQHALLARCRATTRSQSQNDATRGGLAGSATVPAGTEPAEDEGRNPETQKQPDR